MKLPAKVV